MMTDLQYGPQLRLGKSSEFSNTESDLRSQLATPDYSDTTISLGSSWRAVEQKTSANDLTLESSESSGSSTLTADTLPRMTNRTELQRIVSEQHDELRMTMEKTSEIFENSLKNLSNMMSQINSNGETLRQELFEELDELEDVNDEYLEDFDRKIEHFSDICQDTLDLLEYKAKLDNVVAKSDHLLANLTKTQVLLDSNTKRVKNAKNLIDFAIADLPDLTVFEHEDHRIYQVLTNLQKWVREMPMNLEEKEKIEETIRKTDDLPANGAYKCEMIFGEFSKIMDGWAARSGKSTSFNLSSLSELSQTDSEEPKNRIDLSSWSANSSLSDTSGKTSIQSLMTDVSQVSSNIQTAFSEGGIVSPKPPRDPENILDNERHITVFTNPQTLQSATDRSPMISPFAPASSSESESETQESTSSFSKIRVSAEKAELSH